MAIIRRKTASGKIRYDVIFYDLNGRQKWRTFPTKKLAETFLSHVVVEKAKGNIGITESKLPRGRAARYSTTII